MLETVENRACKRLLEHSFENIRSGTRVQAHMFGHIRSGAYIKKIPAIQKIPTEKIPTEKIPAEKSHYIYKSKKFPTIYIYKYKLLIK